MKIETVLPILAQAKDGMDVRVISLKATMPFTISIELACCGATSAAGAASSDADQAHFAAVSTAAAADDGASTEPPSADEERSSCICASSLTAECARSSFGDAADKHVPFVVSAERMCLTYEHTKSSASDDAAGNNTAPPSSSSSPLPSPTMVGIFVPSFLVEGPAPSKRRDQSCDHLLENNRRISEDMLPQIHASLSGLAIRGIISTRRRSDDTTRNNNAIDLVLIELPQREGLDSWIQPTMEAVSATRSTRPTIYAAFYGNRTILC